MVEGYYQNKNKKLTVGLILNEMRMLKNRYNALNREVEKEVDTENVYYCTLKKNLP